MAKHNQDLLDRVISSISIRGLLFHPATLFVFATAAVIGGAIVLWEGHQERIVNNNEYQLTNEKIRLTPQPDWTDADLRSLVIGQSDSASLLDTSLVSKTAKAFQQVGFVDRVQSIEKSKTGLDIALAYRQPVAVVELSRVTLLKSWPDNQRDKKVMLPVDRQGVLMPESAGLGRSLPIITIPYPKDFSKLTTWGDWPDDRIIDAAAIGSVTEHGLTSIGISRIVTKRFRQKTETARARIPFELRSGSGTRIIWGNAPGKEINGEVSVAAKLSALNALVAQHGMLNKINLGIVDIRTGNPTKVGNAKTASISNDIFLDLK